MFSLLLPMPLPWLVLRFWLVFPTPGRRRVIQSGTPALGAANVYFGRFPAVRSMRLRRFAL
ncbi:hypothetical protein KIH07_03610 [Hydrogenophaga taeniospiralis]|uniref:hypothetical protein n=1 Tax=Hydrogenophaga taeniospiralis TaxID=65656 RepID=UPI001CF9C6DE|nr:hypothetical protein [Hydrogenophaga taeniospiralis]MCB4362803.1 hypothetical protein [Hydrogenophaga taeniospiralis]